MRSPIPAEPMHSFSHGHRRQWHMACGHVQTTRTSHNMGPTLSTYTMQLTICSLQYACNLTLEIHFKVKWQLSKQGICWPASHDYIMGSSVKLIKVTCFFFLKLAADKVMVGLWALVFTQIITTSQQFGALLLALAKSIYHKTAAFKPWAYTSS